VRGIAADLELRRPASLAEALDLLAQDPKLKVLAGGTDLLVRHEDGSLGPARLLDLSALPELRQIRRVGDELEIGAGVCYADIQAHPDVIAHLPLLVQAAEQTGARAIQERGTLGGNVANASPAADSVPVLLALGAGLLLRSRTAERRLPLEDFFLDYRRTALRPDELITALRLPLASPPLQYFRKVGTRRAQAISKVALAAAGRWTAGGLECRVALASVAPVPLRCHELEAFLAAEAGRGDWMERAARLLMDGLRPIDDIRSTAAYRRQVAGNLLLAFLRRAEAARPGPDGR